MKIAIAQFHFIVGDLFHNQEKILKAMQQAENESVDVLIFPELALTGYVADDLFLRNDFLTKTQAALEAIQQASGNTTTIVGLPQYIDHQRYNTAVVLQHQTIQQSYAKQILPNEGVFDEKRYFTAGTSSCVFVPTNKNGDNKKIGLLICEDIWHEAPFAELQTQAIDCLVIINASPFEMGKDLRRKNLLQSKAKAAGCDIIYVNTVGGHDDIVFDGGSFWMRSNGEVACQAEYFEENFLIWDLDNKTNHPINIIDEVALVYKGLCTAIRDYVFDNGFQQVCLGLSGGIDSALVLALAVDALGADNVLAIQMPSEYTSVESCRDSRLLADNLCVAYHEISITEMYHLFQSSLSFLATQKDVRNNLMLQNLQARIRAVLLMAVANQKNALLLSTSNKSESVMGYTTLYGDMAGAFAVLKDVSKTWVYRLAHYRQKQQPIFPEWMLTRAPSAELAPNQRDDDLLPSYDILDPLIESYLERDQSLEEMLAKGFDRKQIVGAIKRIYQSEHKRRQAPPGPKITTRALGRERRYPITMGKWYCGD